MNRQRSDESKAAEFATWFCMAANFLVLWGWGKSLPAALVLSPFGVAPQLVTILFCRSAQGKRAPIVLCASSWLFLLWLLYGLSQAQVGPMDGAFDGLGLLWAILGQMGVMLCWVLATFAWGLEGGRKQNRRAPPAESAEKRSV